MRVWRNKDHTQNSAEKACGKEWRPLRKAKEEEKGCQEEEAQPFWAQLVAEAPQELEHFVVSYEVVEQ